MRSLTGKTSVEDRQQAIEGTSPFKRESRALESSRLRQGAISNGAGLAHIFVRGVILRNHIVIAIARGRAGTVGKLLD